MRYSPERPGDGIKAGRIAADSGSGSYRIESIYGQYLLAAAALQLAGQRRGDCMHRAKSFMLGSLERRLMLLGRRT